jgi:hypothetical protein
VSVIPGQPYSGAVSRPIDPGAKIRFLHVVLLVALALSVMVWGATAIAGVRGYELEKFISLAGFFGVACAFFVVSRVSAGFQDLFEIPVFMTLVAFVMFGAAPLGSFLDPGTLFPNLHGDTSLFYPALQIVILGMVAFWLGSALVRPRKPAPAVLDPRSLPGSAPHSLTLLLGVGLYLAVFVAKVYMLRSGMFAYLQSFDVTSAHRAQTQVWIVIEGFGLYALILSSIEAYRHPGDKFRALLFWMVFGSECFWGLISGVKGELLRNLLAVALVSSFARQKLRMRWFALAILGLIALYPLINQYRSIVGGKVSGSVTSVNAATEALRAAAAQTAGQERTAGHWAVSGWSASVSRVNMLQNVALLLAYQDRSYVLEGDERLWMIPFYPFVPRFVWPGKPIEDMGGRFTRLLGGGANSCTSPTIPGDLYVLHGGIPGVLVGMFLLGLAAQWLTNPVKLCPSKRNLFIYACMFFALANWEPDFFSYSTLLIRTFVIVQILALILYGPAPAPSRLGAKAVKKNHRDTEAKRTEIAN